MFCRKNLKFLIFFSFFAGYLIQWAYFKFGYHPKAVVSYSFSPFSNQKFTFDLSKERMNKLLKIIYQKESISGVYQTYLDVLSFRNLKNNPQDIIKNIYNFEIDQNEFNNYFKVDNESLQVTDLFMDKLNRKSEYYSFKANEIKVNDEKSPKVRFNKEQNKVYFLII
jgi:hypothetical protein